MIPFHHNIVILCFRETTSIWVSVDVPAGQPPGHYEGQILITALKANAELEHTLYNSCLCYLVKLFGDVAFE